MWRSSQLTLTRSPSLFLFIFLILVQHPPGSFWSPALLIAAAAAAFAAAAAAVPAAAAAAASAAAAAAIAAATTAAAAVAAAAACCTGCCCCFCCCCCCCCRCRYYCRCCCCCCCCCCLLQRLSATCLSSWSCSKACNPECWLKHLVLANHDVESWGQSIMLLHMSAMHQSSLGRHNHICNTEVLSCCETVCFALFSASLWCGGVGSNCAASAEGRVGQCQTGFPPGAPSPQGGPGRGVAPGLGHVHPSGHA